MFFGVLNGLDSLGSRTVVRDLLKDIMYDVSLILQQARQPLSYSPNVAHAVHLGISVAVDLLICSCERVVECLYTQGCWLEVELEIASLMLRPWSIRAAFWPMLCFVLQ